MAWIDQGVKARASRYNERRYDGISKRGTHAGRYPHDAGDFGDLFGGLASLGARGVDGFVIAKALARLLIQQGIISRETFIETMRQVAREELEESEEINKFLDTTFAQILEQLEKRAERGQSR